jgi:hypothetical protein
MRVLIRRYGAGPLHLLLLLASFALAGAAAWSLISSRPVAVIVWFAGAAIGHDLLLLPIYTLADRAAARRFAGSDIRRTAANYLRIPAGISLLLLLVFLPSIARLSPGYTATTALSASGYLVRWLAVTGALFLLSGVTYAVRVGRGTASKGG